jgi:hypothetical protein
MAFLASSDLLIRSLSRKILSGFSVEIFNTSFLLLYIIIFTFINNFNKIHLIMHLHRHRNLLDKKRVSTTSCMVCDKISTTLLMEHPMEHPLTFKKNQSSSSSKERRKHPREARSIKANYLVKGHWHKGSIQNISEGGAYIGTSEGMRFSPGDGVFMVAKITFLREQVRGKIAWVGPRGMGVEFQRTEGI